MPASSAPPLAQPRDKLSPTDVRARPAHPAELTMPHGLTHHAGPPRADDTADRRLACFAVAGRQPAAPPASPPPMPAAKPISSCPQHRPTRFERNPLIGP